MSVLPLGALLKKLAPLRGRKKIVFTNGCFDLIHAGHLRTLEEAKKSGDVLVVGLNSDGSVRRLKGPKRPILPLKDRARLMAALKPVDFVVAFGANTPTALLKKLKPDVLVKGGDWAAGQIAGREYARKLVRVSLVPGRSTSGIIDTIARRYGKGR